MRWLVGWSSTAAAAGGYGPVGSAGSGGVDGETLQPVGAHPLWNDPDPLWAVGDWRPDEVRVVSADEQTRIAVLGTCGASDEQLRVALFAARGGALRHLTAWPGSYTAVVQVGRRITVCGDLAGARPVFHTTFERGVAYATAALPLADLVEANLDFGHLAALLAAPDVPAALQDSTPYEGVKRVPPGHALILRAGAREIAGYEPVASLAVADRVGGRSCGRQPRARGRMAAAAMPLAAGIRASPSALRAWEVPPGRWGYLPLERSREWGRVGAAAPRWRRVAQTPPGPAPTPAVVVPPTGGSRAVWGVGGWGRADAPRPAPTPGVLQGHRVCNTRTRPARTPGTDKAPGVQHPYPPRTGKTGTPCRTRAPASPVRGPRVRRAGCGGPPGGCPGGEQRPPPAGPHPAGKEPPSR